MKTRYLINLARPAPRITIYTGASFVKPKIGAQYGLAQLSAMENDEIEKNASPRGGRIERVAVRKATEQLSISIGSTRTFVSKSFGFY